MRLLEVLTGNMTYEQAASIFQRLGVDPTTLDMAALKMARKKLVMQHHTDLGGAPGVAQNINAAYDVLSKGPPQQMNTTRPSASSYDPNDGRYQQHYGSQYGGERWEDQGSPRPNDDDRYPIWAQAGYAGGMKETGRIYRSDFTDMNFIKKSMWELSGKSTAEYTIDGYDGAFFRNSLTVYGSPKIFDYMAQAMIDWQTKGGNPYQCRAVFVHPRKSKQLFLIYADGKFYGDKPIPFEHESFNLNPSNDQQFMRRLPEMLDQLAGRQR